ncbi:4-hydroxybenzoate octaprenyltransferase [uncultured Selenomonas sp.]|uniref:4-hydroxybenzoate octaprenyltransferase n=1 Tax=uncultured Selenomonas sp. TaxID=159275 RepID=UPI0028DBDCE4|nr:4-hydroxybenzoate octaprenyltransferase [uncultured Selenomonas sp.]
MAKIGAHINNIALHHIVFALPFAYMSAFLAAGGMPPVMELVWITVAIAGARSAALALDNLADLKYDKKQPRLASRAMVRGDLKPREAKISIVVYLAVCLLAVAQLRPICLLLLPVAVVPFLIYPYTKRFTFLCHLVLGIAIAMAPAGSWVAVTGELSLPAVVLCIAVAIWIGAFDAVYGSQDEAFDRAEGLHSLATQFTARGALVICRFVHAVSIACFYVLGMLLELHWLYYIGVGIAAGTLVYQHRIVSADDYSRVTQRYFMRNGIVSIAMLIFTVASLYV